MWYDMNIYPALVDYQGQYRIVCGPDDLLPGMRLIAVEIEIDSR